MLSSSSELRTAVAMRLTAISRSACDCRSCANFVVTLRVSCSDAAFGIERRTALEKSSARMGNSADTRAIRYSRAEYTTSGSKVQTTSESAAAGASCVSVGGEAIKAEKRASAMTRNLPSGRDSCVSSRKTTSNLCRFSSTREPKGSSESIKKKEFCVTAANSRTRFCSRPLRFAMKGKLSTSNAFKLLSRTTSSK